MTRSTSATYRRRERLWRWIALTTGRRRPRCGKRRSAKVKVKVGEGEKEVASTQDWWHDQMTDARALIRGYGGGGTCLGCVVSVDVIDDWVTSVPRPPTSRHVFLVVLISRRLQTPTSIVIIFHRSASTVDKYDAIGTSLMWQYEDQCIGRYHHEESLNRAQRAAAGPSLFRCFTSRSVFDSSQEQRDAAIHDYMDVFISLLTNYTNRGDRDLLLHSCVLNLVWMINISINWLTA